MAEVKVTGLNIFPVKSCKGCHVDEITIDGHGVVGDRRFMLVDGRGRFISQRKYPKLATVTAQWIDNNQVLHVTNPGMDRDLKIIPKWDGERIETTIWEDTVMTIDQGDEASQWFSQFLGLSGNYFRLVTSAEKNSGFDRFVTNLPDSLKGRLPPMKIALADAGPVSMISNESLSDLNERLREQSGGHEVPLTQFRMNVEIAGCGQPFEEDEWLVIRIGSIPLLVYTAAEVIIIEIYIYRS